VKCVVNHHHLAVIPRQIVRCPRDRDPGIEQPQFKFSEELFSSAVGVGDERADDHAACDRGFERLFELQAIEAEDHDVDRFLRVLDRLHQRRHAVIGLDNELHFFPFFFFSDQSTAACWSRRGSCWRSGSV
jgi:hypothetical protein